MFVCCMFQDSVEEERGGGLRGDDLLHILQQRLLPRPPHHPLILRAEKFQHQHVSFWWIKTIFRIIPIHNILIQWIGL